MRMPVMHHGVIPVKSNNSHQVNSSYEDDPGAELETLKEELETGKTVVDAQFGDLLHIVNKLWSD